MYKIVFVVAVFAFALQGALSSPVNEFEQADIKPEVSKNLAAPAVPNDDKDTTSSTTSSTETSPTTAPKSGASSTEICLLLVQVSSLALVAKHILL